MNNQDSLLTQNNIVELKMSHSSIKSNSFDSDESISSTSDEVEVVIKSESAIRSREKFESMEEAFIECELLQKINSKNLEEVDQKSNYIATTSQICPKYVFSLNQYEKSKIRFALHNKKNQLKVACSNTIKYCQEVKASAHEGLKSVAHDSREKLKIHYKNIVSRIKESLPMVHTEPTSVGIASVGICIFQATISNPITLPPVVAGLAISALGFTAYKLISGTFRHEYRYQKIWHQKSDDEYHRYHTVTPTESIKDKVFEYNSSEFSREEAFYNAAKDCVPQFGFLLDYSNKYDPDFKIDKIYSPDELLKLRKSGYEGIVLTVNENGKSILNFYSRPEPTFLESCFYYFSRKENKGLKDSKTNKPLLCDVLEEDPTKEPNRGCFNPVPLPERKPGCGDIQPPKIEDSVLVNSIPPTLQQPVRGCFEPVVLEIKPGCGGIQPPKISDFIFRQEFENQSQEVKITISENINDIKHIFRESPGHIQKDTPENRQIINDLVNDPKNYAGPDRHNNQWYGRINANGKQIWASVRDNKVKNAGINDIPQPYDPETGLCKNKRK